LKVLRAEGCPWDEWTCACAAHYGHLEMMQWAHPNGCPWDWKTCAWAAKSGHREVLQWAQERLSVGREDVLLRGVGRES